MDVIYATREQGRAATAGAFGYYGTAVDRSGAPACQSIAQGQWPVPACAAGDEPIGFVTGPAADDGTVQVLPRGGSQGPTLQLAPGVQGCPVSGLSSTMVAPVCRAAPQG